MAQHGHIQSFAKAPRADNHWYIYLLIIKNFFDKQTLINEIQFFLNDFTKIINPNNQTHADLLHKKLSRQEYSIYLVINSHGFSPKPWRLLYLEKLSQFLKYWQC